MLPKGAGEYLAIIGLATKVKKKLAPYLTAMDSHSRTIAKLYKKAFKSVVGTSIDVSKIGSEIDAYLMANNYLEEPSSIEDNSSSIILEVYERFNIEQSQIEDINNAFENELKNSGDNSINITLLLNILKEISNIQKK